MKAACAQYLSLKVSISLAAWALPDLNVITTTLPGACFIELYFSFQEIKTVGSEWFSGTKYPWICVKPGLIIAVNGPFGITWGSFLWLISCT